jgi:hypothetical protein
MVVEFDSADWETSLPFDGACSELDELVLVAAAAASEVF